MSRLVEVAGFDALRMVSNRNIKSSASIVILDHLIAVQAWSTIGRFWFPFSPGDPAP
jgi:hypothetical protein